MSVLVNFAMFPTDAGVSKSVPVSKVIDFIKNSGVSYTFGAMGTTIETNTMPEALEIINKAYQILEKDHERIYTTVTIDSRKGEMGRMTNKINAVESKIGKVNK